jgi:hypothetical protein
MPTTTNYGWTTPADTDLVKDGAAAIRTLGSSVDSTLKTQIDNTVAAQIPKTIVDAKGDLIAATAADTVARLAVGTNGQSLIADSTAVTGMKWDTPSSGGMTVIASGSLSGSVLTLSSIPATYQNLQLVLNNVGSATAAAPNFIFRNDTGGNYGVYNVRNNIAETFGNPNMNINLTLPAANNGYSIVLNIFNYANTTTRKTATANVCKTSNSTENAFVFCGYDATAAIDRIDFRTGSGTFSSGTYTLYGVK